MTDGMRSWVALLLGVGVATALTLAIGVPDSRLSAIVGGIIGYGFSRVLEPPRRGPPRYWRGRPYWD